MTIIRHILRAIVGGVVGAGLASLASAATPVGSPSFGPALIILFGVPVPVFSALCGMIGVILARQVAPATAAGAMLGRVGNVALTALLALGVVALIVSGQKQPLVAVAWAVGLGHSGLVMIELVAKSAIAAARLFIDAFVKAVVSAGGSWGSKGGDGEV